MIAQAGCVSANIPLHLHTDTHPTHTHTHNTHNPRTQTVSQFLFERYLPSSSSRVWVAHTLRLVSFFALQLPVFTYLITQFQALGIEVSLHILSVCICMCKAGSNQQQLAFNSHVRPHFTVFECLALFLSAGLHVHPGRHLAPGV